VPQGGGCPSVAVEPETILRHSFVEVAGGCVAILSSAEQLPLVVFEAKGLVNVGLQLLESLGVEVEFLHFGTEEAIGAGGQTGDMDDAL
jgi:hypothetical protein